MRIEAGQFILVLMAGPGRVSWPQLHRHLGVNCLTTATAEEVQRLIGHPPGAVSPFGLAYPVRLLADRGLMDEETISLGASVPNAGVILRREDLVRVLAPERGDSSEGEQPFPGGETAG